MSPSVDGDKNSEDTEQDGTPRNSGRILMNNRFMAAPLRYKDLIEAYYIDPLKHFDFTLVFWSRTFYYFGGSVQAFFKYYLQDVVGVGDAEAAIVKTAIIGQLCAAVTAVPTGLLSDSLGRIRKPFIYFACAILALGQVVVCFVRTESEALVVCGVLGCANGMYLSMDAALALDTLPSGEEAARFMGIWGIGCFVGGALGPVLGGPILAMCGRNPLKPAAYHYLGYVIVFGIAAACFLVSGAILYYVGSNASREVSCVSLRRHFRCRKASSDGESTLRSTNVILGACACPGWLPLSSKCLYVTRRNSTSEWQSSVVA
jgi:MFS family permease